MKCLAKGHKGKYQIVLFQGHGSTCPDVRHAAMFIVDFVVYQRTGKMYVTRHCCDRFRQGYRLGSGLNGGFYRFRNDAINRRKKRSAAFVYVLMNNNCAQQWFCASPLISGNEMRNVKASVLQFTSSLTINLSWCYTAAHLNVMLCLLGQFVLLTSRL